MEYRGYSIISQNIFKVIIYSLPMDENFQPSQITGLQIQMDDDPPPIGEFVNVTVMEGDLEHIVRAQVKWAAGFRNSVGQLTKRQLDASGKVVEIVLGRGQLKDYFKNVEGSQYILGLQCFPERYGIDFPELRDTHPK